MRHTEDYGRRRHRRNRITASLQRRLDVDDKAAAHFKGQLARQASVVRIAAASQQHACPPPTGIARQNRADQIIQGFQAIPDKRRAVDDFLVHRPSRIVDRNHDIPFSEAKQSGG
jgi:hypothetical protein